MKTAPAYALHELLLTDSKIAHENRGEILQNQLAPHRIDDRIGSTCK